MLWRKNTKGNMWAENSAILTFPVSPFIFQVGESTIFQLHRVSLDVLRALKRYL